MSDAFQILGVPKENGILIVADHASNSVPDNIDLGLSPKLMEDHIAIDIGTLEIAQMATENSNYLAILAGFSRLVVDPNRYPDDPDIIPTCSDTIEIPNNKIDPEMRADRIAQCYEPYHARVSKLINDTRPRLVVFLHSFAPNLRSDPNLERPWDVGLLYNEYEIASKLALQHLESEDLFVGDQLPYSGRELNASMTRNAEPVDQPYFGFEIRQDLISFESGQRRFTEILLRTCDKVLSGLA